MLNAPSWWQLLAVAVAFVVRAEEAERQLVLAVPVVIEKTELEVGDSVLNRLLTNLIRALTLLLLRRDLKLQSWSTHVCRIHQTYLLRAETSM